MGLFDSDPFFLSLIFMYNIFQCVVDKSQKSITAVVLTVHWIANQPVPICYTVYRTIQLVFTCSLKISE
jgi:hypothetical protein